MQCNEVAFAADTWCYKVAIEQGAKSQLVFELG